jgi:DNA-binding NarL/FixJ family response regulator
VSIGSSAATVAACVEQGAIGLLDVEALPRELAELAENGQLRAASVPGDVLGASDGHTCLESRPRRFPRPYDTLVHLTPSERRVLFYMMEGCSAAEMATELFVSLTTVRAHIRSILRKLNVSSQLAAVALANGALAVESPGAP